MAASSRHSVHAKHEGFPAQLDAHAVKGMQPGHQRMPETMVYPRWENEPQMNSDKR
jgi:hypothetical protein